MNIKDNPLWSIVAAVLTWTIMYNATTEKLIESKKEETKEQIDLITREDLTKEENTILEDNYNRDSFKLLWHNPERIQECITENEIPIKNLNDNITISFRWHNQNDKYYLNIIVKVLQKFPKEMFDKTKLNIIVWEGLDKVIWQYIAEKNTQNNDWVVVWYTEYNSEWWINIHLERNFISFENIQHELSHYFDYSVNWMPQIKLIEKINSDNKEQKNKWTMFVSSYSLNSSKEDAATIQQKVLSNPEDVLNNIKYNIIFKEKVEAYFGSVIDLKELNENNRLRFRANTNTELNQHKNNNLIYQYLDYKTLNQMLEMQEKINYCIIKNNINNKTDKQK